MAIDDKENRLEQALRAWEDQEYVYHCLRALARALPEESSLQELLKQYPEVPLSPDRIGAVRAGLLQAVTSLPGNEALVRESFSAADPFRKSDLLWMLHGWSRCSRRMYRVPGDLQLLLEATTLKDLWTDIKLPFDSFAVLLDEPLQPEDGMLCDVILFYRYGPRDTPTYEVMLFPQDLSNYKPLDQFTREHMIRAVRQKDPRKLGKLAAAFFTQIYTSPTTFRIESTRFESKDTLPPELTIVDSQADATFQFLETQFAGRGEGVERSGRAFLNALRTALGLGLYLLTFAPNESRPHSPWATISSGKANVRVVTDRAQVCLVQSRRVLTVEDRAVFRRHRNKRAGGYEVGPHPRSGYWSRPRGKGSDPTAEKTVWHEPTIVRKDLLPDGALPLGSSVKVPKKKRR